MAIDLGNIWGGVELPGIDADKALELTRWIIDRAVEGISVGGQQVLASSESLAGTFASDPGLSSEDERIDALIRWEVAKSFTVGFVTNLGGVIVMPVTLPADMAASWIIQARMIGAIACLRGYDLDDERVRTAVLLALVADGAKEILSGIGVKLAERLFAKAIHDIPRQLLVQINRQVGFRLLAKGGQHAVIRLGQLIPVVGGVVGGGFDAAGCWFVGNEAKDFFTSQNCAGVGQ